MIELPKVPLNRSGHYKVLAALERADDHTGKPGVFEDPVVDGGIKGGVGGGCAELENPALCRPS